MTEKDLYRVILSVLQSHFDSAELPGHVSGCELETVARHDISGTANRAVRAHRIGQEAVNDWLSAKLNPQHWLAGTAAPERPRCG